MIGGVLPWLRQDGRRGGAVRARRRHRRRHSRPTGHEPVSVYRLMIEEAFGGERRIAATLTEATPLLLTGLAAAVAFRAGVFNVGAEGCFYLGGIVAAVVGYSLAAWPSLLLIPFALAARLVSSAAHGCWRPASCARGSESTRS